MTGRVAIITGGASGLGRATAKRLAEDGLSVVVADLNAEKSHQVASELPGTGHLGVALDVTNEDAVREVFDTAETALGPVAVLACYAGIAGRSAGDPGRQSILATSVEEWNGVAGVNTLGTFICVREMMRRRANRPVKHSRIILIASMAGQVGGIASGAAYSASKAAVLVLAKVAAREALPIRMTVNAIAPGPIDTPLLRASVVGGGENDDFSATWAELPLGRLGRAEEIAAAASYLVSEDASYVTGATIDVNGGMNMR